MSVRTRARLNLRIEKPMINGTSGAYAHEQTEGFYSSGSHFSSFRNSGTDGELTHGASQLSQVISSQPWHRPTSRHRSARPKGRQEDVRRAPAACGFRTHSGSRE